MREIKIGVCIFDDPKSPRGGFASIDGDSAFYVSGYHELSTETLWVTNLEFPVFRELNLLRLRHLTQAQYFRTSIRMLQVELGIVTGRRLAEVLSKVFSRVASLGKAFLGADPKNYNYRYQQAISDRIFIPGMTEPYSGLDSNVVQLVVDHSTQENQAMAGVKRPDRSSPVTFYYPRDAFAQWLFGRVYPTGSQWRAEDFKREYTLGTKDGRKLSLTDSFIDKCAKNFRTSNRATFFNIAVLSHEASHRSFASFGAGAKEPRTWVTWPELLELLEYSVVTIYRAASTSSGLIRDHLPDYCQSVGCGVSDGLLFENLYAALAAPVNKRNTALGAYLRAYDRAACGRAAFEFHKAGFVVGSYGMGRVLVFLTEGQKERARQVALDNGLLCPLKEESVDG
ncbi:hypothetical protein HNP46_000224 [Pseudomonas nitritireducens]|uniref:Uncharacterized protein n=1 Tax=Pseudomonas nitroreducens TaxID=46680 RepID=A0A7W7NY79_PSENT|nr:hypothetical protein [Pseudomonas nitritireducens]MBB4861413.1 hypothetical protein [Pseudomonas nitritireducens]